MKLKLFLSAVFFISLCSPTFADEADAGLRYINSRGRVRCGIPSNNHILAYKDENSALHGIAVEICRMISTAIFGRADRIKMVSLPESMTEKAIAQNKVDVMIGGQSYSASNEIAGRVSPIDVVYYDHLMFLAQDAEKATSMKDFSEKTVCLVKDDYDIKKLRSYNNHYKLNLQILPLGSFFRAKEALFLKRCQLLVGSSISLKSVLEDNTTVLSHLEILPEIIAIRPVYLFADKNNTTLRTILKWVMNAPKLAEEIGLNQENYQLNLGSKDPLITNLLGTDAKLWKSFGLKPTWVQTMLKEQGNYGEIFTRSLGKKSPFKLKRGENKLLKNNGLITSDPFL